jgi:hypothetical protein
MKGKHRSAFRMSRSLIFVARERRSDFMRLPPTIPATKVWFWPDEIADDAEAPTLDDLLGIEHEVIGRRPHMKMAPLSGEITDRETL